MRLSNILKVDTFCAGFGNNNCFNKSPVVVSVAGDPFYFADIIWRQTFITGNDNIFCGEKGLALCHFVASFAGDCVNGWSGWFTIKGMSVGSTISCKTHTF